MTTKKILIISGCMAVQTKVKGNIDEAALYQNILKQEILQDYQIQLESNILTYSDLNRCFEKAKACCEAEQIDLILCQIRTMDYFLSLNYKKIYRPLDLEKNSVTESDNFASVLVKKFRLAKHRWKEQAPKSFNAVNFVKQTLTKPPVLFLLTCLIRNKKKANATYKKVAFELTNYADLHHIPILFLGASSRPNSISEDITAKYLNDFMSDYIQSLGKTYIDMFGKYDSDNNYKFVVSKKSADKPNLSEIGHREAANKVKHHILLQGKMLSKD